MRTGLPLTSRRRAATVTSSVSSATTVRFETASSTYSGSAERMPTLKRPPISRRGEETKTRSTSISSSETRKLPMPPVRSIASIATVSVADQKRTSPRGGVVLLSFVAESSICARSPPTS